MSTARILQWADGDPKPELPWLVYIATANGCNNRCHVCGHPTAMRDERGIMKWEVFEEIVAKLPPSVTKVYLMKQGEPFVNKRLGQMARLLKESRPDIHVALHTNATLMTRQRAEEIFPYLDSIGISIWATDAETYRKVHGVDHFDRVDVNLQSIGEWVEREDAKRPHVFVDYVYQRGNSHETEAAVVEFFMERYRLVDEVSFHWVFNFHDAAASDEGAMRIFDELPHERFPQCVWPWSAITFCYDGKVSYCFVEPKENVFMGDILHESVESIWHSEGYTAMRRAMASGNYAELADNGMGCSRCSWLFSLKSQSPRSLCAGYTGAHGERLLSMGQLLDKDTVEMVRYGKELLSKGEIHQALGVFSLVQASESADEEVAQHLEQCRRILSRYRYAGEIKRALRAEGVVAESRECRYYRR